MFTIEKSIKVIQSAFGLMLSCVIIGGVIVGLIVPSYLTIHYGIAVGVVALVSTTLFLCVVVWGLANLLDRT
jgi:hypothetical protein